ALARESFFSSTPPTTTGLIARAASASFFPRNKPLTAARRPNHHHHHHQCPTARLLHFTEEEMAAAGSSRFAATCGLLRQYMREQQLGGLDAALRLPPLVETTMDNDEDTDGRTMQLFPTRAGTLSPERPEAAQAKAPLTIMYEGRVLVFEDFPADKAEELMRLAGGGGSVAPQNEGEQLAVQEKPAANPPPAALPDLPIARKASLQRFLQKRKHRITATEPYNKGTASLVPEKDITTGSGKPAREEPVASWLAL
ncbi:unnamed protein product, partial [Urochloa humidicola]